MGANSYKWLSRWQFRSAKSTGSILNQLWVQHDVYYHRHFRAALMNVPRCRTILIDGDSPRRIAEIIARYMVASIVTIDLYVSSKQVLVKKG